MRQLWIALNVAAVALLLLALSCGSRSAGLRKLPALLPASQPASGASAPALSLPALPALGTIPQLLPSGPGRQASYTPADLLKAGPAYEQSLPHGNISLVANDTKLRLRTDLFPAKDSGLGGHAFALYSFELGDFSGTGTVSFDFEMPISSGAALCLLANWQTLRWDSYPVSTEGVSSVADFAPYLGADGRLLLGCLLLDGDYALREIRIGSLPPQPELSVTPLRGRVPFTVLLSAAGSTDPDGSIAEYLWDPEGDGSFVSSGAMPQHEHEYAEPGDYSAALRVLDESGVYNTVALLVQARDYLLHSYGTTAQQYASRVLPGPEGALILCGAAQAGLQHAPLLAFADPLAPEVQAFVKPLPGNYEARDAALGLDGGVYLCGDLLKGGGEMNAVLQKWNSDGSLVWSHEFGAAADREAFRAVALNGEHIYVAGEVLPDGGGLQAIVASLDLNGNMEWVVALDNPASSVFYDLAWLEPQQEAEPALLACGSYHDGSGLQSLYCSYDAAGQLLSCQQLGAEAASETAQVLLATGSASLPQVFISGVSSSAGQSLAFISDPAPGGGGVALPYTEAEGLSSCALLLRSSGQLAWSVSGRDEQAALSFNLLLQLAAADYSLGSTKRLDLADGELRFGADLLELPEGELALAGGCGGPLPELLPAQLELQPLALEWSILSAQAGVRPNLQPSSHSGDPQILDNAIFNRQAPGDSDLLFGIFQPD